MDLTLTDQNFDQTITSSATPVLVDFWAAWCGPCRLIAPIVEQLAVEMEGKLKVGRLDVDANPQTAMKFGVMSIPTLMIFKGGKTVKQMVGYQDKATLVKNINEVISI